MNFSGSASVVSLKNLVYQLFLKSESGSAIYKLSWAGQENSGWSFGVTQFDLANNGPFCLSTMVDIIENARDAAGNYIIYPGITSNRSSNSQIVALLNGIKLKGGKGLTATQLTLIDTAIASSYGTQAVDALTDKWFTVLTDYATSVLANAPSSSNAFFSSTLGQLFCCDLANQYGTHMQAAFLKYIETGVSSVGYGYHQLSSTFGLGDLLGFYFQTPFSTQYPWVSMIRIANEVSLAGGWTPSDNTDALNVLRQYTLAYKLNISEFSTSARKADLNAFLNSVVSPAQNVASKYISSLYGFISSDFASLGNIYVTSAGYSEIDIDKSDATNYILITSEHGDAIFGGAGSEILISGAGGARLVAGTGSDTLIGGQGISASVFGSAIGDTLIGGAGTDTFEFNVTSLSGVIETIELANSQKGSIAVINGSQQTALGGSSQLHLKAVAGKVNEWSADGTESGIVYQYDAGKNQLKITGNSSTQLSGNSIILTNFDESALTSAESASGYAGIYLENSAKATIGVTSSKSAFTGSTTNTGALKTDGSQTFSVLLANALTAAVTLVIKLSGGDSNDFAISTGSDLIQFSNGQAEITLSAGSDARALTLINTKDAGQNASIDLAFSLLNADGSDSGLNVNSLTFAYSEIASESTQKTLIKASTDNDYPTFVAYSDPTPGADDLVITGNTDNLIRTSDGSDSIVSGSGNDYIENYGTSTIVGGGGQDRIFVGDGDNLIYALAETNLATALAGGSQATASGQYGALVATGDGNNTIFGGNGNDAIVVGNGNNVIVLGAGDDTIVAGNAALLYGYRYAPADNWYSQNVGDTITLYGLSTVSYATPTGDYEGNYALDKSDPAYIGVGVGNDTIYGGVGNSFIYLSNGNNYVDAGGGDDQIKGGMGSDTIFGSTGNVTVLGGGGDTYIDGESGDDYLVGQGGNNTIFGGTGDDTIYAGDNEFSAEVFDSTWDKAQTGDNYVDGESGDDLILGSGGNDTLIAGSGNTTIYGGFGNEYIEGGSGTDSLVSGSAAVGTDGAGNTTIVAGDGEATIGGGAGDDTIYGGSGKDLILAGSGNQTIYTGNGGTAGAPTQVQLSSGESTVYGGAGVTQIVGGSGSDTMTAGTGDTTLQGGSATDVMYGGDGNDVLIATYGSDTMYGGSGDTTIQGGYGSNVIYGGDGTTVILAGGGTSTIYGGAGDTTIQGGSGTAVIYAGDGSDYLRALSGSATIYGGTGDDTMVGGSASTVLVAGQGSATMIGGSGQDTFQVGSDAGDTVIESFGSSDVLEFGDSITIEDISISDGYSADSVISGLEIDLAGGGSVILASGNYDNSTQIVFEGDGTSYTVGQLLNSANGLSSVTLTDGSTGYRSTTQTGLNSSTFNDFDSDGVLVDYSDVTNDGYGDTTKIDYSPGGIETSSSYANQDGSSGLITYGENGSEVGQENYGDGSSVIFSDDGQGNSVTTKYDAAGSVSNLVTTSADGSSVSDTYAADGSDFHEEIDAAGNTTSINLDAGGVEIGTAWTDIDGSSGSETINADGTIVKVSTDSQGTTTTVYMNSLGAETSETWQAADGSHGYKTINSDASSLSVSISRDGTITQVAVDAAGIVTTSRLDSAGRIVSDTWIGVDASQGSDVYATDGSSSGKTVNSDGTSSTYVEDGFGNRTTSNFDAYGSELSDSWQKADGSYGTDTFNADGSVSHLTIAADGRFSYTVTDDQGTVTTQSGSGSVGDSSLNATLALESAVASQISDYFVSTSAPAYATTTTGSFPLQLTYSDDAVIEVGSDASYSVTSTSWSVTTTYLQVTYHYEKLYDYFLSVADAEAETKAEDPTASYIWKGNWGSFTDVLAKNTDGSYELVGFMLFVGDYSITSTSRLVTQVNSYTTYAATADGYVEELDTGDSDHVIGLSGGNVQSQSVIINAGSGNDVIEMSDAGTSTQVAETLYVFYNSDTSDETFTMAGATGSFLNGGAGNDTIIGTNQNDVLVGGAGNDILSGGSGSDAYLVFSGDDQGWDTLEDFGYVDLVDEPWLTQQMADYGGTYATDTVEFQTGITQDILEFSWGRTDSGQLVLNISWGGASGIHVVIPSADERALGEGIEMFTFADGTTLTMDQMLALAPPLEGSVTTGSSDYDPTLGYSLFWIDTTYADGSTESVQTYTYADGSTYQTDTLTLPSGAQQQSWSRSDGTYGSIANNGQGQVLETNYSADGAILSSTMETAVSYTASADVQNVFGTGGANLTLTGNDLSNVITANDGNDTLVAGSGAATLVGGVGTDTFVIDANAGQVVIDDSAKNSAGSSSSDVIQFGAGISLGDLSLTTQGADLLITDVQQPGLSVLLQNATPDSLNGNPVLGELDFSDGSDSFIFRYSDGNWDAGIYDSQGRYLGWANWDQAGDGGSWRVNPDTGESIGTSYNASTDTESLEDDTVLANGATESKITYTYADGSTYVTDTVTQSDGSTSETWTKSNGDYGTASTDAATGISISTEQDAGTNYVTTSTQTPLADGDTLNDELVTYADGSTYDSFYTVDANWSWTSSGWSRSDGTSDSWSVDAAGDLSTHTVSLTDDGYLLTDDKYSGVNGYTSDSWSKTDGSHGGWTNGPASGDSTYSDYTVGAEHSTTWTNVVLSNGDTEHDEQWVYADGSTYDSTNTSAPNGTQVAYGSASSDGTSDYWTINADSSQTETWTASDGSHGTNYIGANNGWSGSVGAGDVFTFGVGSGTDNAWYYGSSDQVTIGTGVAADQLWFRQDGNNLDVSILGTTDVMVLDNWYSDAANDRLSIKLSDGETLASSDVQKLVDAMAAFSVPDAAGVSEFLCVRRCETCSWRRSAHSIYRPTRWTSRSRYYATALVNLSS